MPLLNNYRIGRELEKRASYSQSLRWPLDVSSPRSRQENSRYDAVHRSWITWLLVRDEPSKEGYLGLHLLEPQTPQRRLEAR